MKNKNLSRRWFFVVLTVLAACAGDPNPAADISGVYVAGSRNGSAVYWKDGKIVTLSNGIYGSASSILVSGNDVYVTGSPGERAEAALYWKNGKQVTLGNGFSKAIALSGSSVFVAGNECPPYQNCTAKYWKDGKQTIISTEEYSLINAIAVSGTDVYLAGVYKTSGAIWKNGILQKLTEDKDVFSQASSIFISGTDVYAAGVLSEGSFGLTAAYWKNGELVRLSPAVLSEATGIYASGQDVYVTGHRKSGDGNIATVWKNGVPVSLTSGEHFSVATSVQVSGSDVYVSGYEMNGANKYIAKYWKNGTAVLLTDGTDSAMANSIFVK